MTATANELRFPGRRGVQHLLDRIPRESWFAAVGEPLTPSEQADAAAYLTALSLQNVQIAGVGDWPQAHQIVNDPAWDSRWWQVEEDERSVLKEALRDLLSEQALLASLTEVTETASAIVHGAAAIAAGRSGYADGGMTRAAAGAATQTCYLAALAALADSGPDHLFALRYSLFAAGRWPLGIVDGKLHIF